MTPQAPLTRQFHRLWNAHPPLLLSGVITAALGLFFLAGVFLDPRYVTGAPVWLKPLKFAISVSVYSLTLLWLLSKVHGHRRLVSVLAWLVITTFALEWLVIITQAARGVTSHFNIATPLDSALWSLMGGAIVLLWLTHLTVTILVLRQPLGTPAFTLALRLGLIITLIGMAQGFLMTAPTAQQLAAWQAGAPALVAGAHTVGVPDGGPGLPVTGWSTQGGDLRVGHFIGLHALQVLPLLAALLARPRLNEAQQVRLVWLGGGSYLTVTLLATWQALRGQSVTQPDTLTLSVLAALLLATALTAAVILRRRAPRPART